MVHSSPLSSTGPIRYTINQLKRNTTLPCTFKSVTLLTLAFISASGKAYTSKLQKLLNVNGKSLRRRRRNKPPPPQISDKIPSPNRPPPAGLRLAAQCAWDAGKPAGKSQDQQRRDAACGRHAVPEEVARLSIAQTARHACLVVVGLAQVGRSRVSR